MSRRNFALSLVVALFCSTLALANSIPVNMTFLHSGISIHGVAFTYASHSSISGGRATPMNYDAVNRHQSADWNTHLGAPSSGKVFLANSSANTIGSIALGRGYEPTCCKAQNWVGAVGGAATSSVPEPGSLVLLSTGLLGVAGMIRRKLLRG